MVTLNWGKRLLLPFAGTCLLMSLALAPVAAQTTGYTNLSVKGRVQLEIPDNWTINDAEHRRRVKDLSEKSTGIEDQHTASLSVRSFPTPSRMFVRVSFLKLDPPITQSMVRKDVKANRQQVIRELADAWKKGLPIMRTSLVKIGVREVGRTSFAVESLGGQTALVIRYGLSSTINPSETMRYAQYHVPLGAEKAVITLSYIEGDQSIRLAHDRIKKSFVIR